MYTSDIITCQSFFFPGINFGLVVFFSWLRDLPLAPQIAVNDCLGHWIEDKKPLEVANSWESKHTCNTNLTRNWFDFACLLLSMGDLALFIYVEISQALKGCQSDWLVKSWKFKVQSISIIQRPRSQDKLREIECTRLYKSHALVLQVENPLDLQLLMLLKMLRLARLARLIRTLHFTVF